MKPLPRVSLALAILLLTPISAPAAPQRVTEGLQALYDFSATTGSTVRDTSGSGAPIDLRISNPQAVRRTPGSLEIRGRTQLISPKPATRLLEAVRRSGEFTVEAWLTPANATQSGPARIVTLSKNSSERNVTLGQDGDKFDVRFRSTKTSINGLPSLASPGKSLRPKRTHVLFTRDRSGRARLYLDGRQTGELSVPGDLSNWDPGLTLALGDEHGGDRLWLGSYHLVALYNRALPPQEVTRNFQAGAGSVGPAMPDASENLVRFETEVAPLLAKHCLECHDASTRKGKLDLTHKDAALAGGKHGKAIVPGKLDESLLWEAVASDEMPEEGDPLSPQEKTILKKWIEAGAHWPLETLDPANYRQSRNASGLWVQRLTVPEYIETVRGAVGIDIAREAREILPPDLRADGFSNTAYNLSVDFQHIEAYARLATIIVSRMELEKFTARFSSSRKFTDDEVDKLITTMGKWILRGPLEPHEVNSYRGITTTVAAAGGDRSEAVGLVVEAMLQSPRFLYRIERQNGDGSVWQAGSHELASRLSYMLWGGPPDQDLMRAADAGELSDRKNVEKQVTRMLNDERAVARSLQFATEWLNLGRLQHMQPDPKKFPQWDAALATDMRDETLAFFKEVVWTERRPLSDLLNAQFSYLTPRLAKHYGLTPAGPGLARYDLSSAPHRGGLLTQGSILSIGGDEASMVTRGLFVLQDLLRGVVNSPPADVDTTPVPSRPGLTQRDAALQRINDRSCGGCHNKFEPLAFGLEKYDGLGGFQQADHFGNKLREDGNILFPGEAKPIGFATSAELMSLLAGSDRIREALTWKLAQFALGRPLGGAEARLMDEIHRTAQKNGGTYAGIMTALATSDLVQMTRSEPAE